ncbi:MAG: bifunctional 4-hydroxy-2-oxoglutarate aldolase/2-dehydro-3-deoxy-phosphogluconate aldolase [Opitutales bacterium]
MSTLPDISPELLGTSKVIPVVVLEDAAKAVDLAKALLAGGIEAIELTFRTKAAAEAIRAVRAEVPEMVVGAGTILTPAQVDEAVAAGAQFAVAPGHNQQVTARATEKGLPFAPGVMTPTDIEAALSVGFRTLKFFPAESAGGVTHLKSLIAPYQHMGVRFIPTGGISADLARAYLDLPAVLAVGGSWLTPKDVIAAGDWGRITQIARESLAALA